MKRFINLVIVGLLIGALGITYVLWSRHARQFPQTEDAYLGANIVHIAPEVTGRVTATGPGSYAKVHKGELMLQIDPEPFQAEVDLAKAGLAQAEQQVATLQRAVEQAHALVAGRKAAMDNAQDTVKRDKALLAKGNVTRVQVQQDEARLREAISAHDAALGALAQAQAALGKPDGENALILSAKARLASAKLALQHTTIDAPPDGQLGQMAALTGNMAQQGMAFTQLVETDHWWVDANFKETDLARIHPGQNAKVVVDMLPGHTFTGKVVKLSPASGASFSLFPPQNATGNWVKVAQRFPVRIDLGPMPDGVQFRVGASAKVIVDTRDSSGG